MAEKDTLSFQDEKMSGDLERFSDLFNPENENIPTEDSDEMEDITNREVGLLQLSIATSMAIESFCGISPPANESVAFNYSEQFGTLWVNIRTLFRNYLGSIGSNGRPSPGGASKDLLDEIFTIMSTVGDYSDGRCSVMFYFSNYSEVGSKHKGAVVRAMTTQTQKEIYAYSLDVYRRLFTAIRRHKVPFIGMNDLITKWGVVNNAILTHYPYDLLAHSIGFRLTLLESHTGALKTKALWHTKYLDGKNLPMIPFTRQFLQIFGDKETFRPFDKKVREAIIEIGKKYKWNGNTSDSMIKYGLGNMKNKYALDVISQLRH